MFVDLRKHSGFLTSFGMTRGWLGAFLLLLLPWAALWAQTPAPPLVQTGKTIKVSERVWVIPDGRVNLVPNIGIIAGRNATLVVDSGMGPRNGETTLREVRKISPNAPLYLTTTHFHPEHVSGFQVFPQSAKLLRPLVQQEELVQGSAAMHALFSKMSPVHAELLKDVKPRPPDVTFGDFVEIDLGGVTARIFTLGPAHTRGDNFILIKEDGLLFGGDVITNRFFPIISDRGASWIEILDKLAALKPAKIVPGHGEVGDAALIARERAFLALMQARARALKGQGKSADETAALLAGELKTRYPDWDNPEFLSAGIRRFYAESSR
jgi:glyoxylase-like metal-dependent hydrolase (beta-lactamase superfamily II)